MHNSYFYAEIRYKNQDIMNAIPGKVVHNFLILFHFHTSIILMGFSKVSNMYFDFFFFWSFLVKLF